jgi:hypothetical protein
MKPSPLEDHAKLLRQPPLGYIYKCNPIDYWSGWLRMPKAMAAWTDDALRNGGSERSPLDLFKIAQSMADKLWAYDSHDVRGEEIYATALPMGECDCGWIVAWKVENNGSTYVYSPISLPHLHAFLCDGMAVLQTETIGWAVDVTQARLQGSQD